MQSAVIDSFTSALARDGSHTRGCACGSLRDGSSYRKHAPSSFLSTYREGREAKVGLLAGETRKGWAMRGMGRCAIVGVMKVAPTSSTISDWGVLFCTFWNSWS